MQEMCCVVKVLGMQSGGAIKLGRARLSTKAEFRPSSATLTSCTIDNSRTGRVRMRGLDADGVQERACMVSVLGPAGWGRHSDQRVFLCSVDLMHYRQQQS